VRVSFSKAIQQNAFYALGIITMKSISLFMLPFIAHALTTEDFGRMEVLTSFGAVGAILVGFGLLNTLFRFAGEAVTANEKQNVVAEVFGLNLMVGIVSLAAGLFLCDWLNQHIPGNLGSHNLRIMIVIIALEGCISIPLGWLRMSDKASLFFAVSVLRAFIQAGLTVLFIQQGKGLEGILLAGLVAALLQASVLFFIQLKDTGIKIVSTRLKTLLTYSYPMVGSGLLGFVLNGLDRWLLADEVGTAEMATYAIAAKFSMIAALMLQPFLMWWSPRRFDVLNSSNGKNKAAQFAALGSCLSLFIAVAVGLSAPIVIELLLPQPYWVASQYVPWLVLLVVVKDSAELLNLGCYTGQSTKAQFFINLCGSMVGLLGMVLLIPQFHIWGVIAALMAAQVLRLVLYLLVSQRRLYLPYPTAKLVTFALIALSLLGLGTEVNTLFEKAAIMAAALAVMSAYLIKVKLAPVASVMVAK